jgi:glycerol-3-phosphate dehydrogenase (NAD(P)+)
MTRRDELDVLVVGGGSFGTALTTLLLENRRKVLLWVRRPEQAEEISTRHTNSRYLPGTALRPDLRATADLRQAVPRTRLVLVVIPTKAFREVAREIGAVLQGDQLLVHATKGLELSTHRRMSEILREETCALKIGAISGPNLAAEILAGHPAGALVASRYQEVVQAVQAQFAGGRFRVYGAQDVIGTEIGGAFKNIIALAAGVVDGLGMGNNAKSLLLTRGLSEMARFGVTMGAEVFTFGGLAGIGDLMATCASPLSRNHQVGERLAKGEVLADILKSMTQVAEGVPTTAAVQQRAQELRLDLPIVRAVHGMLYEGWTAPDAVTRLMQLPVGEELASLRYR